MRRSAPFVLLAILAASSALAQLELRYIRTPGGRQLLPFGVWETLLGHGVCDDDGGPLDCLLTVP